MAISNKNKLIGVTAGIISGMAYGTNPLFANPLLEMGISVTTMLFFRYLFGMLCMAILITAKRESFKVTKTQLPILAALGLFFSGSSILLFFGYNYIPSGIATTLGYMSPVFIALFMVFLKKYPSWQTWLSIVVTMIGVAVLCIPSDEFNINIFGAVLAILSAVFYAGYLIIVNRSVKITTLSPRVITLYALGFGAMLIAATAFCTEAPLLEGVQGMKVWGLFAGLGIVPTMVSLLTLAVALRYIDATAASILGVFEPLTAMLLGILLFSEPVTLNTTVGSALCIFAVVFLIATDKSAAN